MMKKILSLFNSRLKNKPEEAWGGEVKRQISQVESIYDIAQIFPYVFLNHKNLSTQAATKIIELLTRKGKRIEWVRLSQNYGYTYTYPLNTNEDLKKLTDFPEETSVHLLGLVSMNPNGYRREAALELLTNTPNSAVIPYLLLRLNDWVGSVRTKALEILQSHIKKFHPIDLIKNASLILWLGQTNRVNLKDFQQELYAYIIQPQFREEILNYLKSACVHENMLYWQALKQELENSPPLIKEGLTNKHPEVRLCVVDSLPTDKEFLNYLELLRNDRSDRVYYKALRSVPKEFWPLCKSDFEQGLFHPSPKIREYCRFVLKFIGYQDLQTIYKDEINNPSTLNTVGLLCGWCEVARLEDIQEIQALLSHPKSKVRASAYQALARIEPTKAPEPYLSGIMDSSSRVRRICSQVLKEMIVLVKEEITLLLDNPRPELRQLALRILLAQKPPQALRSILFTLTRADESLCHSAWEALGKWHSRYSVNLFFSIEPTLYEDILTLYKEIEAENRIPSKYESVWRGKNGIPVLLELCRAK